MERLSKRDIKADHVFERVLKDHVAKKKRRTLCISIRGSQAVFSGDEESVTFAQENMVHMTVEELIGAMKDMEQGEVKYKTTEELQFPPMLVKFKGRNWTLEQARAQLQIYLNILGFGKGGSKKYKSEADEPEGWPDQHSFTDFLHPSYAKLDTINDIIASLLQFHGYDVQHHTIDDEEDGEEEVVPRKRRKVCHNQEAPNVVQIPDTNDNNGNLEQEGLGNEDLPNVDEDAAPHMTPYEEMRERNINERKRKAKELGIRPHSEEWDL